MEKGISTIIATILMLMIVIALSGTAYFYISGVLTGKISTAFSLVDSYNDMIIIRNDGTDPITFFRSVTADGNSADLGWELEKVNIGSGYNANQAETYCKTNFGSGWHLYVPSSTNDLAYALQTARSGSDQSDNYLYILGIYPKSQGNACVRIAMTSETCIGWRATDNGKFWVGTRTDILEPNGDNCIDGSMIYLWNSDGTINTYNDLPCPGYTSTRFICEKGSIEPGVIGTFKILVSNPLSKGTHTVRICTSSMCNTGHLTIT